MRFHGGGVGHKATNRSTVYQDARENNPNDVDTVSTTENAVIDNEDARLVEEEDYGYLVEDDDDDEGDDEEVDDMGAEDGEEPWDMNDLEAEGYGKL